MRAFSIAFLLSAFSVTCAICDAAPNTSSRLFGSSIGLNVKFSQGEPSSDLALLPQLGVHWVRDTIAWPTLEPVAGRFADFPADFQERLAFYKSHDIGVDYLLAYGNAKAYPASPENPLNPINAPAFGRYAAHVAKLLKASGVRFILEIWNEPHNFTIQKMVGGEWNGKLPSPWVDHYCAMASEALRQVKALDPNIWLMSQDDMWVIQYWFLEKGLPRSLDALSVHPYWGASPGPERTAVGQVTPWCKPFTVVDADGSLESAVNRLRDHASIKLGHTPSIWATEEGIPVGGKAPESAINPDAHETETSVAANIARTFITNAEAGIETTLWFSSFDGPDGAYGLIKNDGAHRASFAAFQTMSEQLGDCRLVTHMIGDDHRTQGVQAYLFRGPKGDKIVMWDIDGTADFAITQSKPRAIRLLDDTGHVLSIVRTPVGRVVLTITQSPIYITGLDTGFCLSPAQPASKVTYLFP